VAHSLGGDVARTLENEFYNNPYSFKIGNVHKLITMGTPHLGTPFAIELLADASPGDKACTRGLLAHVGKLSFFTATIDGLDQDGAVGDLQGDPVTGTLSSSLANFQGSTSHDVLTAVIAGQMPDENLDGLNRRHPGWLEN